MRLVSGEQDGSRLAWTPDAQDFERTKRETMYEKRLHGFYLEHHATSRVTIDRSRTQAEEIKENARTQLT